MGTAFFFATNAIPYSLRQESALVCVLLVLLYTTILLKTRVACRRAFNMFAFNLYSC